MRPLHFLLLPLAAYLVLPAGVSSAMEADPTARPAGAPVLTQYTGTFKAKLRWGRQVDYGGSDRAEHELNVKLSGRLPVVRFAGGRLLGSIEGVPPRASGTAESAVYTNDGRTVVVCEADSVHASEVPPILQPVKGKDVFYAFASLTAPTVCHSTEEVEPSYGQVDLPALPVRVQIPPSRVGDRVIRIPFDPFVPEEKCPGYTGATPEVCNYEMKGVLTLRLR